MEAGLFVNFYEVFEVEPNAPRPVIERRFRELARRYHPDNFASGDRARFDAVVEAHETLKDPVRRAQYHELNKHHLPPFSPSQSDDDEVEAPDAEAGRDGDGLFDELGVGRDVSIQNNILMLLYHRRRLSVREPGIGYSELETLTSCPIEHLEFHIWYLKAKTWICVEENGLFAITIDGVDRAAVIHQGPNRRISDFS